MIWKKIILLGASNVQYGFSQDGKWASMLSDAFQGECDVINRGFSGYTSEDLKAIVPKIFEEFEPSLIKAVIILIGSNDCAYDDKGPQVSLEKYRENLKEILDHLINKLQINKRRIILISPPRKCLKEEQAETDESVKPYAQACVGIAEEFEVKSLDLFQRMISYGDDLGLLLTDGVHFSELGSELLFEALEAMIF